MCARLSLRAVGRKLKSVHRRFKLKYLSPFLLLVVYTVLGAFAFMLTERDADVQRRAHFRGRHDFAMQQLMERLVEIKSDAWINTSELVHERTREAVVWFVEQLELRPCLAEKLAPTPWTWWGSMFYAGTLYTTIGYGRPSAVTGAGRGVTCLYTLVGIPIFLVILKEVGKYLSKLLRHVYKQSLAAWQRVPPSVQQQWPYRLTLSTRRRHLNSLATVELGAESSGSVERPARTKNFPVSWAVALLLIWIFLCAAFFCIWERDWGYWTSVYFFFVSISTVGLGDVVPSKPDMMIANFILILVGLALLSMCFNLVQLWIEQLLDDMLQQFIDEFEKIAGDDKRQFDIGMSGALASAPLAHMSERKGTVSTAKTWLAAHLGGALGSKRRFHSGVVRSGSSAATSALGGGGTTSSSSASESDSDDSHPQTAVGLKTLQLVSQQTHDPRARLRQRLFSRLVDGRRLERLGRSAQRTAATRSVAVQTLNEFTELLEFLSIPRQESESLTDRSSTYYTAHERSPSQPAEWADCPPIGQDDCATEMTLLSRDSSESATLCGSMAQSTSSAFDAVSQPPVASIAEEDADESIPLLTYGDGVDNRAADIAADDAADRPRSLAVRPEQGTPDTDSSQAYATPLSPEQEYPRFPGITPKASTSDVERLATDVNTCTADVPPQPQLAYICLQLDPTHSDSDDSRRNPVNEFRQLFESQ